MKKWWLLVLSCVLLSGCQTSMPIWERVEDTLPAAPVGFWQEDTFQMELELPTGLSLETEEDGVRVYSTDDGSMEVQTSMFLTSGLAAAVRSLSGFSLDHVTVVETTHGPFPEYQFAWYSLTEQGGRLYRADLIFDGLCCYAVVCSTLEAKGDLYQAQVQQVFSSFTLTGERLV